MLQKTTQVVGGCESGGGDFVCSVVILALSKSFGRLLDEIIAVMMVNYLIMWKGAELRLASENRREQERNQTGKPLSCKYYIHMIISWLIDDLKFFCGLQPVGQFRIKKTGGAAISTRKWLQIHLLLFLLLSDCCCLSAQNFGRSCSVFARYLFLHELYTQTASKL